MSDRCPVCQAPVGADDASCSQCGFRLLGATQKFKPLSVEENERAVREKAAQHSVLRVIRGPQAGVSFDLRDEALTIGRNPQCTIFLNDMTVSRMHASLAREDGCYVIRDEKSYNGVWVNNRSVEAKALASGDFIQIGAFCLVYEEHEGR